MLGRIAANFIPSRTSPCFTKVEILVVTWVECQVEYIDDVSVIIACASKAFDIGIVNIAWKKCLYGVSVVHQSEVLGQSKGSHTVLVRHPDRLSHILRATRIHLFGYCSNLGQVSRIFECHNVVGIQAHRSAIFGCEEQILSNEEYRDFPMVRALGILLTTVPVCTIIHEVVNYQKRSSFTIEITAFRKSFTKLNLRVF